MKVKKSIQASRDARKAQLEIWARNDSPRPNNKLSDSEKKSLVKGLDIPEYFETLAEAKTAILKKSKAEPLRYFTLCACFGLCILRHKRLHVFAPSDSYGNTYWLNGREKPFTKAQRIAEQNATPLMS